MSQALLEIDDVAARLGVSRRKLREFINQGRIPFVPFGRKLAKFKESAIEAFIENGEIPCRAQTPDQSFSSTKNVAGSSTLNGRKQAAAASAARAQRIAERLKKSSPISSTRGTKKPGHVIPLKPS